MKRISRSQFTCKLGELQHSTSIPHYLFHRERSSNCPLFWNLELEETEVSCLPDLQVSLLSNTVIKWPSSVCSDKFHDTGSVPLNIAASA